MPSEIQICTCTCVNPHGKSIRWVQLLNKQAYIYIYIHVPRKSQKVFNDSKGVSAKSTYARICTLRTGIHLWHTTPSNNNFSTALSVIYKNSSRIILAYQLRFSILQAQLGSTVQMMWQYSTYQHFDLNMGLCSHLYKLSKLQEDENVCISNMNA